MMLLGATVWLVVLATSDVHGQETFEYDLDNCTKYVMVEHHAENPDDCRTYYNCDNKMGGKLSHCSEGTVYNKSSGNCVSGGECPSWHRNCTNNPNGVMKYQGQCCNTYFTYSCVSQSVRFDYCPKGLLFNPDTRSCSTQQPRNCQMNCASMTIPPGINRCLSTHLRPVPGAPCEYKKYGTDVIQKCSPGTAFNPVSCDCTSTDTSRCPVPKAPTGCNGKMTLNSGGDRGEGTVPPYQVSNMTLWNLKNADLLFTPFAMRLRFSLNRVQQQQDIMTLEKNDCQKLGLQIRCTGNNIRVTLGQSGRPAAELTGSLNNGRDIRLLIILDYGNRTFTGRLNGNLMNAGGGNQQAMNDWNTKLRTDLVTCGMRLGPFPSGGTISRVTYFRDCVLPNSIDTD